MKDKQCGGVDSCKEMEGQATSRRTFPAQQETKFRHMMAVAEDRHASAVAALREEAAKLFQEASTHARESGVAPQIGHMPVDAQVELLRKENVQLRFQLTGPATTAADALPMSEEETSTRAGVAAKIKDEAAVRIDDKAPLALVKAAEILAEADGLNY